MAINQANFATFRSHLADAYKDLFANDPKYAYTASVTNPAKFAHKMSVGLATKGANKDGEGIRRACKAVGIKHTYKAIRDYLNLG
jgi:hypothetical protein